MSKEEFIKLLDTLDFEELRCATISYYKKKPSKYNYGDEDCNPKTICIGTDLERLINEEHSYACNLFEETMRRINDLESKGE
jgi:hypothetical protein